MSGLPLELRRPVVVDPAIQGRYRGTLELFDLAESMMRTRLWRENPRATVEEIERGLRDLILRRGQAPLGDADGRPAHRFEDQ